MDVTEIFPGVKVLAPRYFEDERGYYCESYSRRTLKEIGIIDDFLQDNHFLSLRAGTIRGIHFQKEPFAQSKLIRCTRGKLLCVAVDLRSGSPTFGNYVSQEITEKNRKQLYIPRGFGHCCMSLEENSEGQYKVDNLYMPEAEGAIRWNDPDINISWPDLKVVVSSKDQIAPYLKDADINFIWRDFV